jgi:hypothetical protein
MSSDQMTIDMNELRSLVREVVYEVLAELAEDKDPDVGLEFKPEVAEYLRSYMEERPEGFSIDDVIQELGLDV